MVQAQGPVRRNWALVQALGRLAGDQAAFLQDRNSRRRSRHLQPISTHNVRHGQRAASARVIRSTCSIRVPPRVARHKVVLRAQVRERWQQAADRGSGEDLGTIWGGSGEDLGRIWGGSGEDLGRILCKRPPSNKSFVKGLPHINPW